MLRIQQIFERFIERKGEKVVISHSLNEDTAQKLKEKILEKYENAEIEILSARGLDSYYAERGGIIVGFY